MNTWAKGLKEETKQTIDTSDNTVVLPFDTET